MTSHIGQSRRAAAGRPPRHERLRSIVERFWYVEDAGAAGLELKLPTTTPQIIINLHQEQLSAAPTGPAGASLSCGAVGLAPIALQAVVLDRSEQRHSAGIVLRPEALALVTGGPATGLPPLVGLAEVSRRPTGSLAGATAGSRTAEQALDRLEDAFVRWVTNAPDPDQSVQQALRLIRRGHRIAAVAEEVGLSSATLLRRFRAATGVTPKRYQRLVRLDRAVCAASAVPTQGWDELALAAGYYDQAHLTHDFTELTSLTPGRWRAAATANPFHLARRNDDFLQDDREPHAAASAP